ncbi:ankyrin repeat-containing domain protein [Coprinopsis sp. MPI-PUGE-AT-0042]|nr:ankyrin repeat-containing domain protein [Coprinopsis sp. MPI-PUGE-AT-0042]
MFFIVLGLGAIAVPPISGAILTASGSFNAVGYYAAISASALTLAARWGRKVIVKLLGGHPEIQVNRLVDHDGYTALIRAARKGNACVAKPLLVHCVIQVNLFDGNSWPALMLAAGDQGVVEPLLSTGVSDINAVDLDRNTLIKLAAKAGHETPVRLLLDVPNVDVSIRNPNGRHTATSAAQANGHNAIAKLLQDFEFQRAFITRPP